MALSSKICFYENPSRDKFNSWNTTTQQIFIYFQVYHIFLIDENEQDDSL